MGLSYEKAGDYYFDKAHFIKAGAFYDSVMATVENENTKRSPGVHAQAIPERGGVNTEKG